MLTFAARRKEVVDADQLTRVRVRVRVRVAATGAGQRVRRLQQGQRAQPHQAKRQQQVALTQGILHTHCSQCTVQRAIHCTLSYPTLAYPDLTVRRKQGDEVLKVRGDVLEGLHRESPDLSRGQVQP